MPFNLKLCFGGCVPSRQDPKKEIILSHQQIQNLNNNETMNDILRSAKTLQLLDLRGNRLKNLPPRFWRTKFQKLEIINLSDNDIQNLSQEIKNLQCIKELDLSKNDLEQLPREIGHLENLEKLLLGANPMSMLPDEITKLKSLKELQLNGISLLEIPYEIGKNTQLETLECRENMLKDIPDSLSDLLNLQFLDFGENDIEMLPDNLGNLTQLKQLWLDKNELSHLPESLGQLENLDLLDITTNNVEKLPEDLSGMAKLNDLTATENRLSTIPTSIGNCKNLTILKLDMNQIEKLPESIGLCHELTELIIKDNLIQSLPKSITNLTKLTHLNIDSNQISNLPEDIGKLSEMTLLSLRSNKVSKLPDQTGMLSKLTVLDVANNNLQCLPISLNNLDLRALWLSDNQAQSLIRLQESTTEENEPCLTCFLLPQMPVEHREITYGFGSNNWDNTYNNLNQVGQDNDYDHTKENEIRRTLLFKVENNSIDNNNNNTNSNPESNHLISHNHNHYQNNSNQNSNTYNNSHHQTPTNISSASAHHPHNQSNSHQPYVEMIGDDDFADPNVGNFNRAKEATPHPGARKNLQKIAKNVANRTASGNLHSTTENSESNQLKKEPQYTPPKPKTPIPDATEPENPPQSKSSEPNTTQTSSPNPKNITKRRRGYINNDYHDLQNQLTIIVDASIPHKLAQQNNSSLNNSPTNYSLGLSIAGGKDSPSFIDTDESIYVSKITPNGACFYAGLKAHDKIIAVGDKSLVGVTHNQAVAALKECSKQNPTNIPFVILRTRQVAEYNISNFVEKSSGDHPIELPFSLALDSEIGLYQIEKISENLPPTCNLKSAIHIGDHVLKINKINLAPEKYQQNAHETDSKMTEEDSQLYASHLKFIVENLHKVNFLNMVVYRRLIAQEELLLNSEDNIPKSVSDKMILLKEVLAQERRKQQTVEPVTSSKNSTPTKKPETRQVPYELLEQDSPESHRSSLQKKSTKSPSQLTSSLVEEQEPNSLPEISSNQVITDMLPKSSTHFFQNSTPDDTLIANPESLNFKDKMALFVNQKTNKASAVPLMTSGSNLRTSTGKISLINQNDLNKNYQNNASTRHYVSHRQQQNQHQTAPAKTYTPPSPKKVFSP